MKEKLKGFHTIDIYLYEEFGYRIRRKIWFFYTVPYWCKQYKLKAI